MSIRSHTFPPALILLAAAIVVVGTFYFASLRPGYSHVANTISELAETGAPHEIQVSFGFFLPVGLLVWSALLLVWHQSPDRYVSVALIALSSFAEP